MEIGGMELEQQILINRLAKGRDLAKQLKNHLNPSKLPSRETLDFLVEKILSSYEKALQMLVVADQHKNIATSKSPASSFGGGGGGCSPRSEGSEEERDCSINQFQQTSNFSKKRKLTLPRWTEQVKCNSSENGQDGALNDGYSWRKYGQKDILGANYPRGYYRCTHRNVQGCLATKQVQKSDIDPTVFEVTYRGRHTCIQTSHSKQKQVSILSENKASVNLYENKQAQEKEIIINFGAVATDLKVKVEELDTRKYQKISSFTFPSNNFVNDDGSIFSQHPINGGDSNFIAVDTLSPPFLSPATSETNYFTVSPFQVETYDFPICQNAHTSDLNDIISASTSVVNSPIGDLDYLTLGSMDFDSCFESLDNPDFFA